jgi:DNA replication and repair protein RecF
LLATRLTVRDFRNFRRLEVGLGAALTVVSGPNGAGKTNLLEAICFACNGRSPRTANERELVRRGEATARVALETSGEDGRHLIEVGLEPSQGKRIRIDGRSVHTLVGAPERPLVCVFIPERLELLKGAPSARRGHIDQVIAAIWPSRADTRGAYSRALAQRNALLGRIRAGVATPGALDAWDAELARHGARLTADRREAVASLGPLFAEHADQLGLAGEGELRYLPRSSATSAAGLRTELAERRGADIERGFTVHGPHRDELQLLLDGVPLRAYGSQGQQRAAVLALLFAERELVVRERRGAEPLMLLDDVMSELDAARRELLAETLRRAGQAILTTTDVDHVPGALGEEAALLELADGSLHATDPPLVLARRGQLSEG